MRRLSGLTFSPSTASSWRGKVDCIVAGFPCQDLSIAGRRAGLNGKRSRASSSTSSTSPTLAVRGASFWRTSAPSLLPPPPLWTKKKASSKKEQPPASWENWPTAGGTRNGSLFQRPTWAPATGASDGSASPGGAWMTPHGMTRGHGRTRASRARAGSSRADTKQATHVAHPERAERRPLRVGGAGAVEGHDGGRREEDGRPGVANEALGYAPDGKTGGGEGRSGRRRLGRENWAAGGCWPTPRPRWSGRRTPWTSWSAPGPLFAPGPADRWSGILAERPDSRRRLNPAFGCWLMGWPCWWTNPAITSSARSEMESYRSALRSAFVVLARRAGIFVKRQPERLAA
jgi:hypothetical protein